jgi:predicted RNA-binding Zn-ribbon protein involved in translation (DUF1610 family)
MVGGIPSYDDYVRTGKGGPEGKCLACGHEAPMDHGMTGYECPKCKSMNLTLRLKLKKEDKDRPFDHLYYQLRKQVEPVA